MRHRLLHSLVFSSSFLLDACASTHASPLGDAGLPGDGGPAAGDAGSSLGDAAAASDAFLAPDEPDAALEPDAFAEPDAAAEPDAGAFVDPRACEPGWPTTKGIFHVIQNGLVYGCRHGVTSPETPDVELCCIVGPAT